MNIQRNSWKDSSGGTNSSTAAQSAGSIVCKKYEIPAGADQKAVTRGNDAANIYQAMMGSDQARRGENRDEKKQNSDVNSRSLHGNGNE